MKPNIEKPVEPVMKFFTPELLGRFNSTDDAVADRADDEWEAAVKAYHQHLDHLCDRMPDAVRKLSRLCLHDAEVLEEREHPNPLFPCGLLYDTITLILKQGDETLQFSYELGGSVRSYPSGEEEGFSTAGARRIWLYDELDISPEPSNGHPTNFLHRVLFSDGTILEIPFRSIRIDSPKNRTGPGR